MATYVPDPNWRGHVDALADGLLDRLAAKVLDNAQRAVPVDTGALLESLRSSREGHTARVGSDLDYSVYVEEGHRVAYRGADGLVHYTGDVVPPEPYLRPSLYALEVEAGAVIEERR